MSHDIQSLAGVNRLVHEPARLMIIAILSAVESADFLYLQRETGLSRGNLSAHLSKLEEAGYLRIVKTYRGKIPLTVCQLTETGRNAFEDYRRQIKRFVENTFEMGE
ncbi:MAG: ArsR family transcriptional regulator [Chloroflexi bacterium RBG_16_58_14]|nr:MAG: ArsR family transcriptional regulator [Chloroflexi bacterium RBG_16_58_14]HLE51511.1 transcriptional regulator [Anaerolineales bacterium]